MLNILKFKFKKRFKNNTINKKARILRPRTFLPAVRNWKNSIYTYNEKTLNQIPEASKITNNLIKGYFNLYSFKLLKKLRKKKIPRRIRYISKHKIYTNEGEFKHTNDSVNIIIYFYNRQLFNYMSSIKRNYYKLFNKYIFRKKLLLIKKRSLKYIKEYNKQRRIIIKSLTLNNNIQNKLKQIKFIENYQIKFYKKYIKKSIIKVLFFIYFKQLIYLNKSKFNNLYLQNLINLIKKIYKKNIKFSFINIKYFFLNSNILTQILMLKLRKNKIKLLKQIKSIVFKTKINNKFKTRVSLYKNLFDIDLINKNINNKDIINIYFNELLLKNKKISNYLRETIFNDIKYKKISGIRLQVSGRLTKRYTASRALSKIRLKGNLKNYSYLRGERSLLIRGTSKSNLDFSKLNSTRRIGSFGIKGWISGN